MGNAIQDQQNASHAMSLLERTETSLRFRAQTWKYFARAGIEGRLLAWMRAAQGSAYRMPQSWEWQEDTLFVRLPELPSGFQPLSENVVMELSVRDKLQVLLELCKALAGLHEGGFYLGFLVPEQVYVHPVTRNVLLDVQPYPSAIPFVDHLIEDYPFILFSRYCRMQVIERASDFYSVGLLMQWMFAGAWPAEARTVVAGLPNWLAPLCERLMTAPASFLLIEEIADECRRALGETVVRADEPLKSHVRDLHPMDPPLSVEDQERFRRFLREDGVGALAVISEDDTARNDVIRQHMNEVFEHDLFLVVGCRDYPYATFREMIERTMAVGYEFLPEGTQKFRSLSRSLDRLMRRHSEGDDIVSALAEWLFELYVQIAPILQIQSLYYMFEGCEEFDEDSQRVFVRFWKKYKEQMNKLHAIFSGRRLPTMFTLEMTNVLEVGEPDAALYRHLLRSMFGQAEEGLLDRLSAWLVEHNYHFATARLLVEKLVRSGCIARTRSGWHMTEAFALDADVLAPQRLIRERVATLQPADLEWMRTFACFPAQVRAKAIFLANGLNVEELYGWLVRLRRSGLLHVYHEDSVFMPLEVAEQVLPALSHEERQGYYARALVLQRRWRPQALPVLMSLARRSGDQRAEYFFMIQDFRQVRSLLSYERKRGLLETISALQKRLGRTQFLCWRRFLARTYSDLNLLDEAETVSYELYIQKGEAVDRFFWMRILMFIDALGLESTLDDVLMVITDTRETLSDKIHAAEFCFRSNIFVPLGREVAELLRRFYTNEVFPNRDRLSLRMFANITIDYTILLFQYFPEHEDSATVLLEMLESRLEADAAYSDLIPQLFQAYCFHSNVSIARQYVQRGIDAARRSGFTAREQVCHLNGMEMSVWQGDVSSYRYHEQSALLVGEIRRKDYQEQFLLHKLVCACEWDLEEQFRSVQDELVEQGITPFSRSLWEMYRRYISFRRGEELPSKPEWAEENQHKLFVEALYEAEAGRLDAACELFKRTIEANGYQLTTGWAYRELVNLLLEQRSEETGEWLDRFGQYLKKYSHDVFWPDYYRASGRWQLLKGDFQRGILFLRRAINGYALIEKEQCRQRVLAEMEQEVQPPYLPEDAALRSDPHGQRLLAEREQFLHHALDLQIIIELCEQVTESLELDRTMERLINALFDYFPVMQVGVTYGLFHRQERTFHAASGAIYQEEYRYKWFGNEQNRYEIMLYQSGEQSITLELNVQDMSETNRRHMEHFVAVIRPHIANAIHYMEMMLDNLTGFYQRRYFSEKLKQEMAVSQRYGLDLSLIMLDIDNFRLVNEYGHQEGDRVLREISEIVRAILRKNDIPGRYGGEELLLILPKTDGPAALKLAGRLREQIEAEYATGRPYRITVSVGVASLALNGAQSVDELIYFADSAEIVAKTTGKNKVVASWLS